MRSRVTSTRSIAVASLVGTAIAATVAIATLHAPAVDAQPASLETSSLPAARDLPRAPAFRAKQLMELPRAGWNTNGGTLDNQRYSPLTQINRDGAIYVVTGDNDAFAIDVDSGQVRASRRDT